MSERPHLRLVETVRRRTPLPDTPRIEVMLTGRKAGSPWGVAGPIILSERGFHQLCREARLLEARR